MPSYWKISGGTLSNKKKIEKGEEENKESVRVELWRVAHIPWRGGKILPVKVLKPRIDSLTFTAPVPLEDQGPMKAALIGYAEDPDFPQVVYAPYQSEKAPGYSLNVHLLAETGSPVLLQVGPKKMGVKFLRIDMNPDRVGPAGLHQFRGEWEMIMHGTFHYSDLIAGSRVTRVDAAVDILGLSPDEILVESPVEGKRHVYVGEDGVVETSYLGVKHGKSGNQYVYDKRRQMMDHQALPEFDWVPHTRVEVRMINWAKPVAALAQLSNPLGTVEVIWPGYASQPPKNSSWQAFLDSCRLRGIKAATERLPSSQQKLFSSKLKEASGAVWRPEKLWKSWPEVVKRSGLLDLAS